MTEPIFFDRGRGLTVGEIAIDLRVSPMTVYRLVNTGELPATRVGRSTRVARVDLDTYLASHRITQVQP